MHTIEGFHTRCLLEICYRVHTRSYLSPHHRNQVESREQEMPNINSIIDVESLEPVELHSMYRSLQEKSSIVDLSDDDLHLVCAILKSLRRKSSGPPRSPSPKSIHSSKSTKNIVASEDLL